MKIFALATVVVDDTDEAAEARLADYTRYVDTESALSLFGGWTGVDLSGAKPEDPLEYVATDANQSALASFTTMAGDKTWTIRDLAEFVAIGGRGPVITGAPATIADEFERWMDEADIDGFNIAAAVRPADAERFTKYVSPELRRRGLLPEPVEGATVQSSSRDRDPGWPMITRVQDSGWDLTLWCEPARASSTRWPVDEHFAVDLRVHLPATSGG